jgi:hypothetical protein
MLDDRPSNLATNLERAVTMETVDWAPLRALNILARLCATDTIDVVVLAPARTLPISPDNDREEVELLNAPRALPSAWVRVVVTCRLLRAARTRVITPVAVMADDIALIALRALPIVEVRETLDDRVSNLLANFERTGTMERVDEALLRAPSILAIAGVSTTSATVVLWALRRRVRLWVTVNVAAALRRAAMILFRVDETIAMEEAMSLLALLENDWTTETEEESDFEAALERLRIAEIVAAALRKAPRTLLSIEEVVVIAVATSLVAVLERG